MRAFAEMQSGQIRVHPATRSKIWKENYATYLQFVHPPYGREGDKCKEAQSVEFDFVYDPECFHPLRSSCPAEALAVVQEEVAVYDELLARRDLLEYGEVMNYQ